ncbi:MAG TPA: hypothetical protein VFS20_32975 [Longimicrobium sp.]|nr:hypothetical protein [Longimicrobium sp.]
MRDDDYLWDPAATADPEIQRLEDALRPLRFRGEGEVPPLTGARQRRRPRVVAALAAAAVVATIGISAWLRLSPAAWTVSPIRGSVAVGAEKAGDRAQLSPGEWVQTSADAAARIRVGRIGNAELGPGSRARLVRAEGTEHRMAMDYGTMHARIWAPPRFFLVETPSALAIDLGCVYTLRVNAMGAGVLRVESGEVELVRGERRTFVVAGNEATLKPGLGPGLPYPVSADSTFRAALAAYEATGSREALDRLLAASTEEHTITLWHLLLRVPLNERALVFNRLAKLAPPPPGVVGDAVILRLEADDMLRWRRAMERSWTTESVPAWKRAWRRLWTMGV